VLSTFSKAKESFKGSQKLLEEHKVTLMNNRISEVKEEEDRMSFLEISNQKKCGSARRIEVEYKEEEGEDA
jgi:hypothetical protein